MQSPQEKLNRAEDATGQRQMVYAILCAALAATICLGAVALAHAALSTAIALPDLMAEAAARQGW